MLEFKNNVELCGFIGNVTVQKVTEEVSVARFSLATNRVNRNAGGAIVVETTWHSIIAWDSKQTPISDLEKGKAVRVRGFIRNNRFVDAQGREKDCAEIVATSLEMVDE